MNQQREIVERNRLTQQAVRGGIDLKLGDVQLQVTLVHYTPNRSGDHISLHQHQYYELSMLCSGGMHYHGEGCEVALEKSGSEWVLIAPGVIHRRAALQGDSLLFGFALKLKNASGSSSTTALQCYLKGRILKLDGEVLLPLTERIEKMVVSRGAFRAERLRLILGELLLELFIANFPAMLHEEGEEKGFSDTLELVDHYIEENLTADITVDDIARRVGISRRHLYRLFTEKHGVPLKEYIIRRRLNRAAAALIGTSLPVKEIAAMSGFRNLSYFTRQFRRVFIFPPASYRKQGG